MTSFLSPGPEIDNNSIKVIAKEISKPFYKKLDFIIMVILEFIVIGLAVYYGNIQISPILEEQRINYFRKLNACEFNYEGTSFTMRDGSTVTCRELFPDLKKIY